MQAKNWSTVILFFSALLLTIGAANAGPREAGYALYRQGAYKQALKKFTEAYHQSKKPGLLYNVGKCHEKLGQYTRAIHNYQRYLKELPTASDRTDVEQIIAALSARIEASYPEVELVSSPPGANVRIDGEFAGQTPFKVQLSPGKHITQFTLKRFAVLTKEFQVKAGKKLRVAVLLSHAKATGKLKVLGNISGARVSIDGLLIGLTPLTTNVSRGEHRVSVEKKGYSSWSGSVRIEQDGERVIFADLKTLRAERSIKTIFGWSLLGAAAVSEGLAWLFYTQAVDQYQGTSEFERNRGLTIGLHIGAGVLAVASAALLLWSGLEPKAEVKEEPASSVSVSFGLSSLRVQW
ncbi:MAG: PEGA domain-containing protein [Deltaproteobacteria bacterium]|nr:PEGA domain-containing protein [Deltaproteobacteria bacterium]